MRTLTRPNAPVDATPRPSRAERVAGFVRAMPREELIERVNANRASDAAAIVERQKLERRKRAEEHAARLRSAS